MRMKKLTAWTLSAAMLSSMLPAPVFAAEANAQQTPELITETVSVSPDVDLPSNDELFAAYADSVLYGYEMATFGEIARAKLNDIEKKIYDELKTKITAVAENGGNTVFELTNLASLDLQTEWAVNDLNVTDATNQEEVSNALGVAFEKQFNWSDIIGALLSDCPLDLYWYDKTQSTGMNYTIQLTGTQTTYTSASVTKLTFTFKVAKDYQNDSDTTAKTADLKTVKDNAQEVVNANKDKTPYEKLKAYKEYICEAVSYNQKAVDENYDYGDPWQLIYVFDGDSKTNVVCEGYSKAFQYLCDLSDIECISVTGDMNGGAHMWNVVTLDGQNYLVDVTNCDDEAVGSPDKLFMQKPTNTSTSGSNTVYTFEFDESNTATYTCDNLSLADDDYVVTYPVNIGESEHGTVTAEPKKAAEGDTVTLTVAPDEGYALTDLTVTGKDDKEVTVSEGYTFTMPAGAVTVTATFEKHNHNWSYKAEGATITATCGNTDGGCPIEGETKTVTLTLVAPVPAAGSDKLTYDGKDKVVTVEQSPEDIFTDLPEVDYGESGNINAGEHTATLTMGGKTATVSFTIGKADPTYTVPTGLTATYGQKLSDVVFTDTHFAWADATQLVGNVGDNKFTATYTPDDTDNYNVVEDVEVTVKVNAKEITAADVTVSENVTYNGSAQKPTVTINGLAENTDYTVTYERDGATATDFTNVGVIKVIVNGKDNYTGTVSDEFTIDKKEISISGATITDLVYNENATSPYALNVSGVTFKAGEDDVSLTSEDYTATAELNGEYAIAQNVAATVTVNLKNNNYTLTSNTYEATVNIVEHTHAWTYTASGATITATCGNADTCPTKGEAVTLKLAAPELTYNGSEQEVTVEQTPEGVFADTALAVTYKGVDGKPVNAGEYEATLTMDDATAVLNFTIAPKNIEGAEIGAFTAMTYTGEKQTPVAAVTIEGIEGEVTGTWSDVTEVGEESTFTPDDKVNFTGTLTKDPKMAKADSTVTTAPAAVENLKYNAQAQALVTAGAAVGGTMQYGLVQDGDYTTTIPTGTNAGEYTVWYKVVGDQNHNDVDAQRIDVTISPKEVSKPTFVDMDAIYAHTGEAITPTFTLKDGENVIPDTEYTVAYSDNTDVGTATITITDNTGGNYAVSGTKNFEIKEHEHVWNYTAEGADIKGTCVGPIGTCPLKEEQKFTLTAPESLTYDSKAKEATVTGAIAGVENPAITYTGDKVTDNKAVNAGTYIASITLTGNDGKPATAKVEFTIAPKNIEGAEIGAFTEMTYTGEKQTPEATVTIDDLTVTGTWSKVTNVADKTTFTANGNFTGKIENVETGMAKAPQDQPTGLTPTAETLKGQANGTITGLTDKMEYVKDTGVGYTAITGNKLENLAAGTYYVRFAADDNHNAGPAAEVTIAEGKPITVTFDANGQKFGAAFAATLTGQSYGLLTKPNPGPTAANSDFAFVGWYKDAACKDTWNFDKDTLTKENVTIYAKWEQKYFEVKVDVKDHEDKAYAEHVTIKLMRGNDEKYSVTGTSAQGSFTFQNHVEAGAYNLVVTYGEDGTKTELITVDGAKTITIKLPASGVKSELTVTNDAVTPDVMVGGLDDEAASVKNDTSGAEKVLVSMDVKGKEKSQVNNEVVEKIEQAIGNTTSTVAYLDISIEKKVDDAAGTPITETTNVIEILIPLGGRYNIKIIRHHDNAAEAFAQNTNKTDGTFYIDTASGYIHIFTKKFSTYAVSSTESCTITFNVNGGTGNYSDVVLEDGTGTVTLPENPSRTGYTFKGWYTASTGGTKVTAETVFTGDTTVYAQWTQNSSGSNPGSNSNNDYSGGNYTPSAPTYPVSAPTKVSNGSVSISSKNATKGSTVTLTVTPDEGYELASLIVTDKNGNELTLTNKGNGKFSFIMPASKVSIKATFEEIAAEPETPVNPFYDIAEGDYYFDAVLWANEHGITSGVGYGLFAPHATCTRAQMVTFLWNAAGCPNVSADYGTFTDVTANDYYYKAVLWANANNITSGTGNGAFSPNQICTRAQMATFLYQFAEGQAEGTYNPFVDVTANDYYAQPVQWAVENGITSGTGANTFGPNDPCTRAQMVTFLYRLLAE